MKYSITILALILSIMMLIVIGEREATAVDTTQSTPCVNGMAQNYPCHNVDMLAHLPLSAIGGGESVRGSDHWGWTDPQTGRDYVIFGLSDGTSFIDITERNNPIYLGKLPGRNGASIWRDIKVYQNVAYITADIPTNHGLQLFDLTQLRDVTQPPVTFSESNHYNGFGPGHNLWVNEESGFLYVFRSDTCNNEIHMINVQDPLNPVFAGCFIADDDPLSDAECVIYDGPDTDYSGHELCFIGSDDNVSISDVNDKSNPYLIIDFFYEGMERAHQGALTPDQRYWLLSDTEDEEIGGHTTRTHIFDIADLDQPLVVGFYEHTTTARDHNVYIIDNIAYETNWKAGLRVLDISNLPDTNFVEVGYFDTAPDSDSIAAAGAWSNYPWWDDDTVTVSDTDEGLFVLRPYQPQLYLPLTIND